jgi:aldehyde dehydrogenase (NAD+)
LVAPLIAMGNRVVALPSESAPLSVTDLYQVLDTSDMPAGVINIVTGDHSTLAKTMAGHNDIDALWCFADDKDICENVEGQSISNLKQTWTSQGKVFDWYAEYAEGEEFLRRAPQVKNIWIPYGE